MGAQWILARSGGRAPLLVVSSRFVRVCVLFRKTRQRRLPEDGIKVSPPSLRSGGASSIVGRRVEVCLRRIYPRLICSDLVVVRLCSCAFGLDPFDLRYSSSATVAVLVRWSYIWSLSTTTSRLSTTTSCARLRRGRGDDGGAPSARFSACSRR